MQKDFSLEKAILWIMDGLKCLNVGLTSNKQFFTSQDINCWTGVVWIIVMFYQLFGLSF